MSDSITTVLVNLQSAVEGFSASLAARLRPGLSSDALDRAEAELRPYVLPNEVRSLFRWHDGAEEPMVLFPGYRFLSFAEALDQYRFELALSGGSEGWNPLWFPLLSLQGDFYCTTLSHERREHSPIFLSYRQETALFLICSSLRACLLASAQCFQDGAYMFTGEYLEENDEHARAVRARYHCEFPAEIVDGVTAFDKFSTLKWPEEWRAAIGRTSKDYEVSGASSTIADCNRRPREATVHARVIGVHGTSSETVLRIGDRSGTILVLCPKAATGAREIQISRRYEMRIRPSSVTERGEFACDFVVIGVVPLD